MRQKEKDRSKNSRLCKRAFTLRRLHAIVYLKQQCFLLFMVLGQNHILALNCLAFEPWTMRRHTLKSKSRLYKN